MAEHKSIELTQLDAITSTASLPAQTFYDAKLRRFSATLDLSATTVASGDTVVIARVPKAYRFAFGIINASATLGTSTIAVSSKPAHGGDATSGKYRAAAVFTAAAPTLFGKTTSGAEKTDDEIVYLEAGTADLPTSGTLSVDLFYSAAL